MASNATIFKLRCNRDMDRITTRTMRSPGPPSSETDERMMLRLLAFVRHAHADLAFGRA